MTAYYNEIDPYAAQWLRNLIAAGHIAPGIVDERSIEDVTPNELKHYTQCHFFAGIGVWSLALRRAGWSDDRPVWTGSCPCQPFSSAGKGGGFDDERHLWPAFHHLIEQCRPATVIGEQVASKDAEPWLDLVQTDLEAVGYAFGAVPFPSASVGAPHIRDRLYWVANAKSVRSEQGFSDGAGSFERSNEEQGAKSVISNSIGGLANTSNEGLQGGERGGVAGAQGAPSGHIAECDSAGGLDNNNNKGLEGFRGGHSAKSGWQGEVRPVGTAGSAGGLADAQSAGLQTRGSHSVGDRKSEAGLLTPHSSEFGGLADTNSTGAHSQCGNDDKAAGVSQRERQPEDGANVLERGGRDNGKRGTVRGYGVSSNIARPGPTNGFWGAADWLLCRDGKWRPVEPGTFPLVNGASSRVGRLRAYGNAINAQAAQVFIECIK